MKGNVLARKDVQGLLSGFVVAELYTDRARAEDRENARLMRERYGSVSLPLYLVVDGNGNELARLEGVSTAAEFTSFLEKGRAAIAAK